MLIRLKPYLARLLTAGFTFFTLGVALSSIAQAAPSVTLASAEPAQILIGQPTKVRFSADIGDPKLIAGGANLLRVGAPGTNPTIVGVLRDDGSSGDEIAGDGRYSLEVTLSQPAATQLVYRISAAFKGQLLRVNSADIVVNVLLNRPPVALPGTTQAVRVGTTVLLDGRNSFDLDGNLLTFRWTLAAPNGSAAAFDNAALVKPSFTADVAGTYRAQLIVNDGQTDSVAKEVLVQASVTGSTPPTAVLGSQALPFGNAPTATVPLTGAASFDPEGAQLTYAWQLVGKPASSTTAALSALTGATPALLADKPGRYTIELTVKDGALESTPVRATITLFKPNTPPTVDAGADSSVTTGTAVALSGVAADADADSLTDVRWAFIARPAGSAATLTNSTTLRPSFVADVAGDYLIELVVTDSRGAIGRDRVLIRAGGPADADRDGVPDVGDTCANTPAGARVDAKGCAASQLPAVTISALTANPASGIAPLAVNFVSQATGGSGPYTYGWTFGDATSSSAQNPTHTYLLPNTYTATVIATDTLNNKGQASVTITATADSGNQAPVVNAGAAQTITLPGTAALVGTATDDGLPSPPGKLTTTWGFVSGPATGVTFFNAGALSTAATFQAPGTYVLRLTASDGVLSSTSTVQIAVNVIHINQPPRLVPQGNATLQVGTPFARTLTATDPDAGDILVFALVSGPAGMTLNGASLNWPTDGKLPADYPVTVKVTDAAGLSDTNQFTVTLQSTAAPVARDDTYTVRVGATLNVPVPGVLANDVYAGSSALAATRLTAPDVGTLTAFNGDGSFTYQAPATMPKVPLTMAKLWNAATDSGIGDLVADLNGDGYPDIITVDSHKNIRASSGLDGVQLWRGDITGATDCNLAANSGGSMERRVLADIDDSGRPSLVLTTECARADPTRNTSQDSILALDYLGKVKWVSPPLSKPHPDIRRGATPVPPGGFTPGGLANGNGLSVARLSAGGPPVLLMRAEISINYGNTLYVDAAGAYGYAGCRAVTGLPADENVACRATFIISGTDGSVLQTLVVRNPAAVNADQKGPDNLRNMPPIAMDIDGDGRMDLVSGTEVWMQNAGGGFDFAWQLTTSVNDTAVADLDGDGKAEIIHLRASGFSEDLRGIFIYGHDGQFKRRIPLRAFFVTALTIADVDGDGRSDIIVGGDGTLYVFRDDGRPIWAFQVPQDVPPDPIFAPFYTQPPQYFGVANAAPQVYDLDGDGVAEVVFTAYARIIILNGRTGLRKLDPYWTFGFSSHNVSPLMLIDMNDDGRVDIVQNTPFLFNCLFVGANFLQGCLDLAGPTILSGGGANNWLPGPKTFPNVQYRSTAIDANARVLHDTKVSRVFRVPEQQGTVRDPRLAQAASFTYAASDGAGTSAPAQVIIDIVPDNQPPVFTSIPPKSLVQRFAPSPPGGLVTNYYNVAALDPDPGDTITFSLKSAPSWVTMSGPARVRFEPTCGSYGYPCPWGWTTVIVTATDSRGASTDQIFIVNLTTTPVTVPNVVGMSFEVAKTALIAQDLQGVQWVETFSVQPVGVVLAQDAVAGTVVGRFDDIRLTVSKGPMPVAVPFLVGQTLAVANAELIRLGFTVIIEPMFSTTIPANQIVAQTPAVGTTLVPGNANPVTLTVSTGPPLSGTVAQVLVKPAPAQLLVGDALPYRATAIFTDGTSADVTLSVAWSASPTNVATMNDSGSARAVAPGAATITATIGSVSGQATLNVAARAVGDNVAPTALIASPASGSVVFGPISVVGTAMDANFHRYELAIALAGDKNYTQIAEGTTAVTNGTLATLDPTTLVNDLYTLRLTVFDKGENESVATSTVQVKGDRKVGLFSLTYLDLNVPAAGIPLTVSRTYDSRDKAKGDFGIGWRLGLQTLRIRTNRVLGTGWIRTVSGPLVSLAPTSEHKVSVTLPDGRVEEFDMIVSPTSNIGSLDFTKVTGYQARSGTQGKLVALTNNSLLIVNGGAQEELVDDYSLDTYDPQLYRYTTVDGTQIEISPGGGGVKKVTDPNGNAVTFGPSGILHSNGTGIVFTRDAKDRIVAITDLLGNVQTYAYDGNGDLVTHTNPVGGVSRFLYDRNHGLIEARDTLGNQAVRNEYDGSGRLVAVIDAKGKRVAFTHNDAVNEDLVTDRLGNIQRLRYDDQGNVLSAEQGVTINGVLVNAITTKSYDSLGNTTLLVDPDGQRLGATYSGVQLLTQVTDPGGLDLTTSFAYNARNDVTSAVDAGGRSFAFTYDARGNITAFDTPLAGSATSTANAQGKPVSTADAMGNTTAYTRNAAGQVTREDVLNAASTLLRRTEFVYDANGNTTSMTVYRTVGGILTAFTYLYGYDAANRQTSVTDPVGGVLKVERDASGRVIATVDPLGRRTKFDFDSIGQPVRTTFADGTFESVAYDANGNVASETDRAGRTTTFTYDELGRQVKVTLADGSSMQTIYTPGGKVAATIDANGNRTDYTYDAAGRRIATTLPAVANGTGGPPLVRPQVAATLNDLGIPVSATDAMGRVTTFLYDANGRLTKTTHPGGSTLLQAYDALGRRTSVTNEEGQSTTFGYDGLGRLISVAGLAGDATYAYDEAGNLVTQTDALGRITRFRYDALNRMIERTYPGGDTEQFAYDAVGNVVARIDGLGRTTTFAYDTMNRLVAKTLPGAVTLTYSYKPDGQRSTVTDPRGVTTIGYDSVGRLASIVHPTGETVSYARDANGNLVSLASPAATVNYGYDALNRLLQVNSPEGQSNAFYDLASNRVRQTLANGVVSDVTFDNRNRPTSLTHKGAGNAVLQSFTNVYSPAGRRSQTAESDGSVETYTYNAKGRLAAEVRSGSNPYSITHSYDAVGNRTQMVRGGAPTAFAYDSNDRLLSDGTSTYGYDANGNLITRTNGPTVTQYGYDPEGRLVTVLGGGVSNQYTYDADGNRVQANTASGLARFLVDGAGNTGLTQVLEERSGGGSLIAHYSYGKELIAMSQGGSASLFLHDVHGSTRGLANGTGTLTDSYTYDAYGNAVATSGSSTNPYRFSGERQDADTGLYQLRDRYYNPSLGRFVSRDPFAGRVEAPVSRHRYQFANSDPVNHVDPTGRETLAEVTLAGWLSNTIDVAASMKSVRSACFGISTLEQVSELLFYTAAGLQLAMGSAAVVAGGYDFGAVSSFSSVKGAASGEIPLLDVMRYLQPVGRVDRITVNFAYGGGKVGAKAAFRRAGTMQSFEVSMMGPPLEFKGGAGVKGPPLTWHSSPFAERPISPASTSATLIWNRTSRCMGTPTARELASALR